MDLRGCAYIKCNNSFEPYRCKPSKKYCSRSCSKSQWDLDNIEKRRVQWRRGSANYLSKHIRLYLSEDKPYIPRNAEGISWYNNFLQRKQEFASNQRSEYRKFTEELNESI